MNQRAIEHHLGQSEFSAVQAGTLSHLLAEQATKEDLRVLSADLRREMSELRGEMRSEMSELRGEMGTLRGEIRELRTELRGEMRTLNERLDRRLAEMKSRMTWSLIAAAAFMGTVMSVVGAFV